MTNPNNFHILSLAMHVLAVSKVLIALIETSETLRREILQKARNKIARSSRVLLSDPGCFVDPFPIQSTELEKVGATFETLSTSAKLNLCRFFRLSTVDDFTFFSLKKAFFSIIKPNDKIYTIWSCLVYLNEDTSRIIIIILNCVTRRNNVLSGDPHYRAMHISSFFFRLLKT